MRRFFIIGVVSLLLGSAVWASGSSPQSMSGVVGTDVTIAISPSAVATVIVNDPTGQRYESTLTTDNNLKCQHASAWSTTPAPSPAPDATHGMAFNAGGPYVDKDTASQRMDCYCDSSSTCHATTHIVK